MMGKRRGKGGRGEQKPGETPYYIGRSTLGVLGKIVNN